VAERAKFMKILRAELEDLLEDLDAAEHRVSERLARRELTDYVARHNEALFRAEADSLRRIIDYIDCLDFARYPDLGALVRALDILVREVVRDHEEPEAAYRFVSRKIEKVRRYVQGGLDS
jgi:hypothetical protein